MNNKELVKYIYETDFENVDFNYLEAQPGQGIKGAIALILKSKYIDEYKKEMIKLNAEKKITLNNITTKTALEVSRLVFEYQSEHNIQHYSFTQPVSVQERELNDPDTSYEVHNAKSEESASPLAREITRKLRQSKNVILRGVPGTGKSFLAKNVASQITGVNRQDLSTSEQFEFVQFHPSYDYTDFVEGLRPFTNEDGQVGFERQDGVFKRFVTRAIANPNQNYVFIIDEINRGEISKIFGELFFAIDPGYRGQDGAVSTQYANLNGHEPFYIPRNVYILGTMNDIDRSVDSFDFAMRRRFRFIEISANVTTDMWDGILDETELNEATARLTALNEQISATDELNDNYHVGPSYFLKLPELDYDYAVLWDDYLAPLLEEYLRGSYNEEDKLAELKAAYTVTESGKTNDVRY